MRWIKSIRDDVSLDGKKRKRGYVTRYPTFAATQLIASRKVVGLTDDEARREAPHLFDGAGVLQPGTPAEDSLDAGGEEPSPDADQAAAPQGDDDDAVDMGLLETINAATGEPLADSTSAELAEWLQTHHPDETVPRLKDDRQQLIARLLAKDGDA